MSRVGYIKGTGNSPDIKVVYTTDQPEVQAKEGLISERDAEMDKRAVAAVKAVIEKAKICKKPIARYDTSSKKAYIEYADGRRKYFD